MSSLYTYDFVVGNSHHLSAGQLQYQAKLDFDQSCILYRTSLNSHHPSAGQLKYGSGLGKIRFCHSCIL